MASSKIEITFDSRSVQALLGQVEALVQRVCELEARVAEHERGAFFARQARPQMTGVTSGDLLPWRGSTFNWNGAR